MVLVDTQGLKERAAVVQFPSAPSSTQTAEIQFGVSEMGSFPPRVVGRSTRSSQLTYPGMDLQRVTGRPLSPWVYCLGVRNPASPGKLTVYHLSLYSLHSQLESNVDLNKKRGMEHGTKGEYEGAKKRKLRQDIKDSAARMAAVSGSGSDLKLQQAAVEHVKVADQELFNIKKKRGDKGSAKGKGAAEKKQSGTGAKPDNTRGTT
mmetsp:Transcript_41823/g.100446  ORF Transcript_41823/g.100446 Transcript_41823/m.100446 type:complete len:205 (+) Transcript_41823:24-638(+)